MTDRFEDYILSPFRIGDRISKILVGVFLLVNGTVLFNALFHPPFIGYDAADHNRYIRVLSEFRLPSAAETREFFSPPLPYFLPAILYSTGQYGMEDAAKFAQWLNVLYSLSLTFYLIKICERIRPGDIWFKILSLGLLSMLPIYYKTFAFVRGEPLVALLAVFVVFKTLDIVVKGDARPGQILLLGVGSGLLILARQWGFFVLLGVVAYAAVCWLRERQMRSLLHKVIIASQIIALFIGGWFYLHLYLEYGSVAAVNRNGAEAFSFANQPLKFYFGLGSGKLFSDPVRPAFPNQLIPIFYSEIWGDYWCYFVVYGISARTGRFLSGDSLEKFLARPAPPAPQETNRYGISPYLGRVNLVSLFPSAVLFAGLVSGMIYLLRFVRRASADETFAMHSLLFVVIVISGLGYFWFLVMYPSPDKGGTIKATYLIHAVPLISILAGEFLVRIKEKSFYGWLVIVVFLALTSLHNLPTFFTHYAQW